VRRVLESIGLKVNRLIRLAYGPFALGTLASGAIEEVGPRVIREQLAAFVPDGALPTGERPLWRKRGAVDPRRTPQAAAAEAAAPERRVGFGDLASGDRPAAKKAYKPGWAKP